MALDANASTVKQFPSLVLESFHQKSNVSSIHCNMLSSLYNCVICFAETIEQTIQLFSTGSNQNSMKKSKRSPVSIWYNNSHFHQLPD